MSLRQCFPVSPQIFICFSLWVIYGSFPSSLILNKDLSYFKFIKPNYFNFLKKNIYEFYWNNLLIAVLADFTVYCHLNYIYNIVWFKKSKLVLFWKQVKSCCKHDSVYNLMNTQHNKVPVINIIHKHDMLI